jgi:hypothetical protein
MSHFMTIAHAKYQFLLTGPKRRFLNICSKLVASLNSKQLNSNFAQTAIRIKCFIVRSHIFNYSQFIANFINRWGYLWVLSLDSSKLIVAVVVPIKSLLY